MAERTEASTTALDRLIGYISPMAALKRRQARQAMAYYDAAKPGRLRRTYRDASSPDRIAGVSADKLRMMMRQAERDHDLVRGSLDVLVANTVGPNGIGVEPQPRRADGSIHEGYARTLRDLIKEWEKRPEVTWTHDWQACQRLMARTYYRDGEAFAQQLTGPVQYLQHGSRVPYSLELLEPDMVPLAYTNTELNIRQGCQRDSWGRRQGWWVYKIHPGDLIGGGQDWGSLKFVPGDRMIQLAQLDRIGQLRGITRFASVITRLEDLRDYEESERIAAKVAAMLTAYVKRQAPAEDGYTPNIDPETGKALPRELAMSPGMIIDTLAVGEEIGIIDSKRPNPNLVTWRGGQLRAFAAGIGASYSSISHSYEGTYSSQRQELVESYVHYAVATDEIAGRLIGPTMTGVIQAAQLGGLAPRPRDVVAGSEFDFLYVAPSMPWIDPVKEAAAWLELVQAGFATEVEVIRRRGGNPDDVLAQVEAFRLKARAKRLGLSSDLGDPNGRPANGNAQQQQQQQQQAA